MMKKICTFLMVIVLASMMCVPVFAAEFTPSVEAKPAPEVMTQTGSDGNEYAAIIYDGGGNELVGVPVNGLTVTPVSASDTAPASVREALESAYDQLKSVNSLSELSGELESVIREISPNLTVDDLVARDLFDVSVTGAYTEYLNRDGASISIRFKLSADAESLAAVLHNTGGTVWETVSNDRITRNDDYTADVIFFSLSPVAFLFDAGTLSIDPDAPASPQTGEPVSHTIPFVVGGVVILGMTVGGVAAKKRSQGR